jgi:hypothetical protein
MQAGQLSLAALPKAFSRNARRRKTPPRSWGTISRNGPLQDIEITSEFSTKNHGARLLKGIVRDAKYPGMYRLLLPGGGLSDMVNLTRAKDALRALAERNQRAM